MLRLLLPSIMGTIGFLSFVWIAYYFCLKYLLPYLSAKSADEKHERQILRTLAVILTFIALLSFALYVLDIASVNEISRSETDRSGIEQGKNNFEDRMHNDANMPKVTDTTTNK